MKVSRATLRAWRDEGGYWNLALAELMRRKGKGPSPTVLIGRENDTRVRGVNRAITRGGGK
jgi:hypothetical protein